MSPSLFPPLDEKNTYEYRAVGVVRGRYYPSTLDFHQGTLVTNESVLRAVITSRPNRAPEITLDMIENELLFCVYPKTRKAEENALILYLVKPRKQNLDVDSCFSIRGNLVAIWDDSFLVRIHRNGNPEKVFYLGIKGTLPDEGLKKFWDLECVVSGQYLQLVNGQVVGKNATFAQKIADKLTVKPLKLVDTQVAEQPKYQIIEQTNNLQHKVTIVKSEITLKFNEIPVADPAPNKKVKLILVDENENRFMILLNSKSYKKAVESAASYTKYAGNISGKLGKLTPEGFEVLDAGIKIFELKSKEQALEEESV